MEAVQILVDICKRCGGNLEKFRLHEDFSEPVRYVLNVVELVRLQHLNVKLRRIRQDFNY